MPVVGGYEHVQDRVKICTGCPDCCHFNLEMSQQLCRGYVYVQLNFEEEL